jgi:hypothetical protein
MKKQIAQWTVYIIPIAVCAALHLTVQHYERVAREKRLQQIGEHGVQVLANMKASDIGGQKTAPAH